MDETNQAAEREKLIELIQEHLTATYHCTRVWDAWNVGTMTQDDFEDARESDLPFELADAILTALARTLEVSAPVGDALEEMRARKDAAYLERNQVVAALARCYPSGVARTAIEGWSDDWHGCVYIDLPTGQVSWHFHDSQAYLFDGLPPYSGTWDGHDTPEKYRRLAASRSPVAAEQAPSVASRGQDSFHVANAEGSRVQGVEPAGFDPRALYLIGYNLNRYEWTDEDMDLMARKLMDMSGICTNCHGDGIDGEQDGDRMLSWACTDCNGSGSLLATPAGTAGDGRVG
jgi:hypothetical protein